MLILWLFIKTFYSKFFVKNCFPRKIFEFSCKFSSSNVVLWEKISFLRFPVNCSFTATYTLVLFFRFWPLHFLEVNFSKITLQNFIENTFSNRVNISLLEYTFLLKFCGIVIEKFDFQEIERERYKNDRITKRLLFDWMSLLSVVK